MLKYILVLQNIYHTNCHTTAIHYSGPNISQCLKTIKTVTIYLQFIFRMVLRQPLTPVRSSINLIKYTNQKIFVTLGVGGFLKQNGKVVIIKEKMNCIIIKDFYLSKDTTRVKDDPQIEYNMDSKHN